VWVVSEGQVSTCAFDPSSLGLARASVEQLRGADASFNASVARSLLAGETGPVRDAVLLNAAAAIAAYDGGSGDLVDRLAAALTRAADALSDGRAAALLDRWVEVSRELRPA
jgi:anthranilate phosphoribosyltransferase